jgi:hypothetical protein
MNNLSPYPEYTKQTRTNNNIKNTNDFLKPVMSNNSIPLIYNHDHYDNNNNNNNYNNLMLNSINIERNSLSTRNNIDSKKIPVQQNILNNSNSIINGEFNNNYYTMNFDNKLNNSGEVNDFLTRNPVNTRRDTIEKSRKEDLQYFMTHQGGSLNNFTDFKIENTRKNKTEINSSNYIPMPRTMAIPKENI